MTSTTDILDTHLWHPYTRHSTLTQGIPMITRGEGIYLYDDTGRQYIDAISSWWCCNLGHSHPRITAAIKQQLDSLQHSILGNLAHPSAVALSQKLAALMPDAQRHVLYASDGASAVEAALKLAVQYWDNVGDGKRKKFASLTGAYHGDTLGAVSVGYLDDFHRKLAPLLFPVYQAAQPTRHSATAFASMQEIFDRAGDELAAVIVEPLCQGAAGMNMYSPDYLTQLAALCKATGALLIVDEIAMGFGRTGKMFAYEHASIDPDIVCIGKAMSAGYLPISATIVKDSLYETFRDGEEDHTFYHGHTFAGNPLASAAALETLRVYEDDQLVEQAHHSGQQLEALLSPLRDLPYVRDLRCLGMIGAAELDLSRDQIGKLRTRMLEKGLLTRPLDGVFYLMPPLTISESELDQLTSEFIEVIRTAS